MPIVFSRMPSMRPQAYLKNSSSPIEFHRCLLQLLGCPQAQSSLQVNVQRLDPQRITIEPSEDGIPLKHPPFCPMFNDPPQFINSERGVDVGVCGLLVSRDEHVLLTRRSKNLRTFPGAWVPPGGAIDPEDDSLLSTCVRELSEETGLKDLQLEDSSLLCAWESVYPYSTDLGNPKRHHLVLYYVLKSKKSKSEFEEDFFLQRDEVDAVTWISSVLAAQVSHHAPLSEPNSILEVLHLHPSGDASLPLERKTMPSSSFFCMTSDSRDRYSERITTGTMFALSQWSKS